MGYLIFGTIIVIAVLLILRFINKLRIDKKIDQIRSSWINRKRESFDFVRISRYADLVEQKFHRLTDQTIEDIDFHKLFAFIDRTTSKVGQQFLYKKVIEPTNSIENQSEVLIKLFSLDKDLRERTQLELLKLSGHNAYYISSLLGDSFPERPKWFVLLTIDIIIMVSLTILSFKFPVILIYLIFPFMFNMFLHYWNKKNTFQFTRSIPQLNQLINVSRRFVNNGELPIDRSVEESIIELKPFQRKTAFINFENKDGVEADLSLIGSVLTEFLKAFFLIEVLMIFQVVKELRDKRLSILMLFNYVGGIDSALSIAALRTSNMKTCRPVFTAVKKELVLKNAYHPLINNCVKNSLTINNKSILITGSNMSGKSTFLRTLTINSILAQTINTCFADEYISPVLRQFSSILIDDNLFEGKSYYFQEVNTIGSLVNEAETEFQNLFILDEVFKGTNTIERIAAGKAILTYLNRNNNIVVVSTHDIELADMLKDEYDLYHFTEIVENNKLHFDHRIKVGQVRTRNAIKILELSNYPEDILIEARQISNTLRTAAETIKE